MNALAIGCLAVTALLWGTGVACGVWCLIPLIADPTVVTQYPPLTVRMRWRQVRPDVWTLGTVGALFGLCGFALWGIG